MIYKNIMKNKNIILIGAILFGLFLIAICFLKSYQPIEEEKPSQKIEIEEAQNKNNNVNNNQNTITNPASVNCVKNGGNLVIEKNINGGEYGLCYFDDARACEEWAMMRGDCPVGGVKTTGYDTEAQKYCAWIGGKTLAQPNAVCNFNDGSSCLVDELYKGICQKGIHKASNVTGGN